MQTAACKIDTMIEMVSLKRQLQHQKLEINKAIEKVVTEGSFIQGETVKNFEQKFAGYLGQKHVVSCANGTDALQLALMVAEINIGDEVIIPSFSYVSPAEVTALLKAKIVFADVNEDDFLIAINGVETLLSAKTKAVIPVHLFGAKANCKAIQEVIKGHQITIIEDAAQSIGNKINSENSIVTTSFFPTKNLACFGDGGALIINDDHIAHKLRSLANHGQVKKYEHQYVGINSRLDALQAAVLSVKLNYLDEELAKKKHIANQYLQKLSALQWLKLPIIEEGQEHCWHQFTVRLPNKTVREHFKNYLIKANIASVIYYPKPLHLQKAYQYLGYKKGSFPVAEKLADTVLSLPIHPYLSGLEVKKIIEEIKKFKP